MLIDRIYVISLARRQDRAARFFSHWDPWPFAVPPTVFPALDGERLGCPPDFRSGAGAWGCRCSHVRILEDCLTAGVESVLIFEDDAEPLAGFHEGLERIGRNLPPDWQCLMFGGEHWGPTKPRPVADGIARVGYARRTHAYAVRGPFIRDLYHRYAMARTHIDWTLQDWVHRYRVYAASPWIVGQAEGPSDISGRANAAKSWN